MSLKRDIKHRMDKGVRVSISVDIRKVENVLKSIWNKLFKRKKK